MNFMVYTERCEAQLQFSLPELLHDLFHGLITKSWGSGLMCYPKMAPTASLPARTESDPPAQAAPTIIDVEWCDEGIRQMIGMRGCHQYEATLHVSEASIAPFINDYA